MEFNIENFRAIYPQFADLSDEQITFMAQNALIISGLDTDTRVPASEKYNLWYMLICHLATLATRGTAGAMTSAKEGDVQVSFAQVTQTGGDGDWYNLTPCGSVYWQIIKRYRLGGLWFKGRKTF